MLSCRLAATCLHMLLDCPAANFLQFYFIAAPSPSGPICYSISICFFEKRRIGSSPPTANLFLINTLQSGASHAHGGLGGNVFTSLSLKEWPILISSFLCQATFRPITHISSLCLRSTSFAKEVSRQESSV